MNTEYNCIMVCVQKPKSPLQAQTSRPDTEEWKLWHDFEQAAEKIEGASITYTHPTDNIWLFPMRNGPHALHRFLGLIDHQQQVCTVLLLHTEPLVFDAKGVPLSPTPI